MLFRSRFIGAWLRPRMQLPMGFGDATRKRFADEANAGQEITRQQLRDDQQLLARYQAWWFGKRVQFLAAMRNYLRENGVEDAMILFTAASGEPGVPFDTWEPLLVTDDVAGWKQRLSTSANEKDRKVRPISIADVVSTDL